MACRPGPLRSATPQTKTCLWGPRYGRSLRDLYIPFGLRLPLVAYTNYHADQREAHAEGGIHVTK